MEPLPLRPHLPPPLFLGHPVRGTPEARAFLQERLELLYRSLFCLSAVFYVVTTAVALVEQPRAWWRCVVDPSYGFHLLAILGSLGLWLACRGAPRSARALVWLDGGGLLGVLLLLKLDARFDLDPLSLLLCTHGALVSRAVFVPSTVRRTFWLSLLGALPDGAIVAWMGSSARVLGAPVPTLDAVLWSAIAVFLSTLVCRVVHGLRTQMLAARQLGQYTLIRPLGAGAMGEVFLARHSLLRRHTALKLLRPDVDGQGLERFEREVQLTSQLTHPNTIAIYDYGRTDEGVFYYVMEYLEGVDLEGLLSVGGPQPAARVIHLLLQVCGALEEAHDQGLLHRDIKPANLFVCRKRGVPDWVKVLDFGLVMQVGATEQVAVASPHQVVGTPLYLAPEAIVSPERVDARSDLYSLGAVGYALLTGQHVFEGRSSMEICSHHLNTSPTPPSERLGRALPEDVCAVLLRCLAKRPEERYASARELRRALERCEAAGHWSEAEAERWWEAHGDVAERVRPSRDPSALTGEQTVVKVVLGRVA